MKCYTHEMLHLGVIKLIEFGVLISALSYTYRFFRGTFDAC